jgi:hypothetical protein
MKSALRVLLLVLALLGFLVFLSFNIENLGPKQTVTVGINISPWLTWSRIKGIGEFGKKMEINFLSWSAAGLVAGIVLLALRSRVK